MADINQTITWGIGTPAGIPEFLTLGLQIGAAATVQEIDLTLNSRSAALTLQTRSGAVTLDSRSAALTLRSRT